MSKFKNERRSLLKGAAIGGAVASLPVSVSAALKPIADHLERADFLIPDFVSVVGETVSVTSANGIPHAAEITEVSEIHSNCSTHPRPVYVRSSAQVVRFRVADTAPFGNDVYCVSHANLGSMDLLLSVVPDARGELGLEAIFN